MPAGQSSPSMPPPAPAERAGRLTRERVFDVVKAAAAVSLAPFSLYSAIFGVFQDMVQKGTHLALVLLMVFLASCRRRGADSALWRPIADLEGRRVGMGQPGGVSILDATPGACAVETIAGTTRLYRTLPGTTISA